MTTTTKSIKPIHLIDATLYAQVIELENIKAASKSLKAKEDELKEAITAKMYDMEMVDGVAKIWVDPDDDPNGIYIYPLSRREITLSFQERKTLSKELLLSNGVSPEIIAKSTTTSEYTTLRHKKVEVTEDGN